MTIKITANNLGDLSTVTDMMKQLIESGAECVVEVSGNTASGHSEEDLRVIAKRVIRGDYGNGAIRIERLKAAGFTMEEINKIQQYVEEMI